MKWVAVLIDEHAVNSLQDMDDLPYQFRICAEDSRAFGKLMPRGFKIHDIDLENSVNGLPK